MFPVISGGNGISPILRSAANFDLELLVSKTLDGNTQALWTSCSPQPAGSGAVCLFGSALTSDRPWCGDSPFWVPSVAVLVVVVVVLGVPVAVVDVVEVVVV